MQTPLTQPALLVRASAIATLNTDDEEQVYVFSQMLGRIQIFDTNGTFRTSITIPKIKGILTLCGGGEHPILLATPSHFSWFYQLKQGKFIGVENQPLPPYCQLPERQVTAVGQYRYWLRDWPKRITYHPIDQHKEDLLITEN